MAGYLILLPTFSFLYLCIPSTKATPMVPRDTEPNLEILKKDFPNIPTYNSYPLRAGFPGLIVENLDEYLSQFPHCLTVLHNHQGIDLTEWTVPIYLMRIETTFIADENDMAYSFQLPIEKLPPRENITYASLMEIYEPMIYNLDIAPLDFQVPETRFNCYAQFDLFYPEKFEAFQNYLVKLPFIIQERNILRKKAAWKI